MALKAAQARQAEAAATGQVQLVDTSRPLAPSNSFWDESYDLPQWFTSSAPDVDTPTSSSLLDSSSSSNATDRVDESADLTVPASPIPASPTLDSSDSDTVVRVQAVAATPDPPPITIDDIRTAQAADDNLLPVIQALLDQKQPASADLRQYPEETRVLFAQWLSLIHI